MLTILAIRPDGVYTMSAQIIDFLDEKAKRNQLRFVHNYNDFCEKLSEEGRQELAKLQASVEKFAKLQRQFFQQKFD